MPGGWWVALLLGILTGIFGREAVYDAWGLSQYWWVAFILTAFFLGILIGKIRTSRIEAQGDRLRRPPTAVAESSPPKAALRGEETRGIAPTPEQRYEAPEPAVQARAEREGFPARIGPRKRLVRLTKVSGKKTGQPLPSIVGVEESAPQVGKEYEIVTERGTVLRTSPVIQVVPRYIQTEEGGVLGVLMSTQKGVYEVAVIEER